MSREKPGGRKNVAQHVSAGREFGLRNSPSGGGTSWLKHAAGADCFVPAGLAVGPGRSPGLRPGLPSSAPPALTSRTADGLVRRRVDLLCAVERAVAEAFGEAVEGEVDHRGREER
jgi:hypothetical protein